MSDEAIAASILGGVLACIAGWATHVIVCMQTGSWLLLIAGAIAFPIGIVHGIGIWFGAFS